MTADPLTIQESESQWLGLGARRHFLLDPDYAFLNHGSFGATPRVVLEVQDTWRQRMETHPVHFHVKEGPTAIREMAGAMGAFLGTSGDNLVFVENATTAINAVLRSFSWKSGDEIVYTNHGYGAINNAVRFAAKRFGARAVEACIPFPIQSPDEVVASVEAALTPATRLAVLDHITSPTALVLPVDRLIALCHERGIPVAIDGAHAPGMLPLELDTLGADYYTGNCHKWLFAAKGCAFLYAHPNRQTALHPPVISWGCGKGFTAEFDWTGTKDITPWLSLSAAIDFFGAIAADRRRAYNNALATWASKMLLERWNVKPTAPPSMLAHMVTLPLPVKLPPTKEAGEALHDRLYDAHKVEVPIIDHGDRLWVRISAQAYNVPADYDRLAMAIVKSVSP